MPRPSAACVVLGLFVLVASAAYAQASITGDGVDLYNVMNSALVLTYNQACVPTGTWLTPTSVLQARFFKISAQIDF